MKKLFQSVSLRFFIKSLGICFITLLWSSLSPLHSQNCTTFENIPLNPNGVNSIPGTGWRVYNWPSTTPPGIAPANFPNQIRIEPGTTGGSTNNTTRVITADDISGSTHLINNSDYNGNWIAKNSCFCFDIKLISDGDPGNLGFFTRGVDVYNGLTPAPLSSTNPTIRFTFILANPYSENTPWRRICLPIKHLNTGDPLPSNSDGHWIASANLNGGQTPVAAWNALMTSVTAIGFFVDVTGNNQNEKIGLDNLCFEKCPDSTNTVGNDSSQFCCPGTNMVRNGGFGITAPGTFNTSSTYTQQSTIALSSIVPGQYGIINQTQAATVSPTWLVQNHGTCTGTGNFLAVNGRTGQTVSTIWQQQITVMPDSQYRFCAYVKNLPQCGFDVKPKISVWINGAPYLTPTVISVPPSSFCNWQMISFNFTALLTSTANIEIRLDETGLGDGNDLAIDDISFTKLASNPINLAQFQISTQDNNPNDNFYQITATPDYPLPVGCRYGWLVCETDPADFTICYTFMVGGTLSPGFGTNWNYASTNFPGFCCVNNGTAIGKFEFKKSYRISLVIDCDCQKPMQWTSIINVQGQQFRPTVSQPTNFKLSDADIRNAISGKSEPKYQQGVKTSPTLNTPSVFFVSGYPNPAKGTFNTKLVLNEKRNINLDIYDITGKLVSQQKEGRLSIGQNEVAIPTINLANGTYVVKIWSKEDGVIASIKMVVMN